jgi:regulator of ribonuclease activity A
MTTVSTADLWDAFGKQCTSCETQFKLYGAVRQFRGPVRTVRCFDDNALLRQMLNTPSRGEVLVVDGKGSLGAALIGDVSASLGVKNGWAGVIIYGAIRDASQMMLVNFGVKALGTNPKTSTKLGTGEVDVSVSFGGVTFNPGDWVYSDEDGTILSPTQLQ